MTGTKTSNILKFKAVLTIFLLFLSLQCVISATYQLPFAAYSLDVDDIDLDGDKDIVIGHNYCDVVAWGGVSIWENDGSGYFDMLDSMYMFSWQTSVYAAKLNNDEYPEIICRDFYNDTQYMAVIENNMGQFSQRDYFMDFGITDFITGDIDSDKDIDIVFYLNESASCGYMLNNGDGEFSLPVYYDLEYSPTDIACGDLNNDGRDDFLVCNRMDAWLNLETGLEHYVISEAIGLTGVDICDVDNDGDNDLVGSYLLRAVLVFLNDGAGNFELVFSKEIDPWLSRIFISDINGDNYPDIIYNAIFDPNSEEARYSFIMHNNKDNTYTDPIKYQTYFGDSESIASLVNHAEDVDGNGLKDIITVNCSYLAENNLNILYQDSLGGFVATSQTGISNGQFSIYSNELYQNYPNPFNPVTQINFALSKTADVKLSVYNINGQKVAELANGSINAGLHAVDFDGSKLNSGVYYYTLETDGKAITKKMIMIK